MGSKIKMRDRRAKSSLSIFIIVGLCFFFYVLGAWQKSGFGKGDSIALEITRRADCTSILSNLSFETHHNDAVEYESTEVAAEVFEPCNTDYTDYTPCQDLNRATSYPLENLICRERHCPRDDERLRCLIPAPKGYMAPFPWPISREYVPFVNVPYESLTVEKVFRSWVKFEGNIFKFPGRETMFSQGVEKYIEELASVIPLGDGTVRTALDIGCGVASWGAYLLSRNVLAMSFSPRDAHTAQVQFALERGIPAVIGVLGTVKLPYPSRAFDMVHCSQCLIPWTGNGGMYMMEVDRVLRSGGYWILSGSPINWKAYYETWKRSMEELQAEQEKIEKMAERLCWEKKYEKEDIAIWQKRKNSEACQTAQTDGSPSVCALPTSDDVWYKKIVACISPVPKVSSQEEVAGGALEKFPQRLFAVPPRISLGYIPGVTINMYQVDNRLWKKHVHAYKKINNLLDTGRYRNIMDMNAGFGSFAAYMESPTLWVMNVVPTLAKNTLGVIYERGLIGIYHDWCEGFSTYPRSYDLLHASGVLSLYQNKCNLENILLEMDRILRPEGAVVFRDEVDVLNKVRKVVRGMRWNTKMMDHEDGPLVSEKILVAVKQYWTANATSAAA